ncbi:hypothetical protein DFA_04756 [Cavenderia fasciculata]|uniref:Uncharacterized protein n=1 Tax=Cavenderia fasciculata TaxID=261658 RepID=F4PQG3_CACFS|nr:uncharacterized protein DFA_04756 [Cavenderia fasciculata]EGG22626.1 hypothetical protein DFA_04756 [Cavenderia fasciculata]|eukprot:XP_004360477.1 hypothetical protein DFA_04756 [Cavenderia fasciculata]
MDMSKYVQSMNNAFDNFSKKFDALVILDANTSKRMASSPNWHASDAEQVSMVNAFKDTSVTTLSYEGKEFKIHPRSYDHVLTAYREEGDDYRHLMLRIDGDVVAVAYTSNFLQVNELWLDKANFTPLFGAVKAFSGAAKACGAIAGAISAAFG